MLRTTVCVALLLTASCSGPAPVAQEPLVPPEPPIVTPSTPLQHCCVESGGTLTAGCEGAEAVKYGACIDRVATLEAICPADTVTTTGCSSCPTSLDGDGPLVLDKTGEVSEGDHVLRVAEVSGCGDKPSSFALHRIGDVAWTHIGEPLPFTCKPKGDVAFVCGDKRQFLEVDEDENTAKLRPIVGIHERGIGLANVGTLGQQRANVPKIVPGRPAVMGSLDKEIVRRVVRQHRRELKYCYEEQLKLDADLTGRFVVSFTIKADGTVAKAQVVDRTSQADPMEKCLVDKIERWVFPQPKGGGIVIVKYPFNFST